MKQYNLAELTDIVRASFAQYDKQGTKPWSWEVAAQDLSYQVGSLAKITLQLSNHRWADGKDQTTLKQELQDELADILAEVVYIASELKIDLNQAIDAMAASDRRKVESRTS